MSFEAMWQAKHIHPPATCCHCEPTTFCRILWWLMFCFSLYPFLSLLPCISYGFYCCDKIPNESNLRKKFSGFTVHPGGEVLVVRSSGQFVTSYPGWVNREGGTLMPISDSSLFFSLGPQTMDWCHPHSVWVVSAGFILSGDTDTDTPRGGMFLW